MSSGTHSLDATANSSTYDFFMTANATPVALSTSSLSRDGRPNQSARDVLTMLSWLRQAARHTSSANDVSSWLSYFVGKKGKKKKGVTVNLMSFLADGKSNSNVPLKSTSWADDVEDDHGESGNTLASSFATLSTSNRSRFLWSRSITTFLPISWCLHTLVEQIFNWNISNICVCVCKDFNPFFLLYFYKSKNKHIRSKN